MNSNADILARMTPLQKADLAIADLTTGTILLPKPAQEFMQLAILESKLLPLATVRPLAAPIDYVPRIAFADQILRPAQDATALGMNDRTKPAFSNVELATKPFIGEVRIPDTVLQDNIEKDRLKSTIMTMMTKAIGRDLEKLAILGDTASNDVYLKQFDGALKLATSHVVDANVATLNRGTLTDMLKTLPDVYQADEPNMKFITSRNAVIDLSNNLGNRIGERSDQMVLDGADPKFMGLGVVRIPMFPNNLGSGTNCTDVLLMNPKNLTVGIWQQIQIETARDISARVTIIVVTIRIGVQYALEDAIVKAINVKTAA